MSNFFAKLIPFLMIGIAIVAFAFGLILIAYLVIFGAMVGFALFLIAWIKQRFFSSKKMTKSQRDPKSGRTIDHDDKNV